MKIDYVKLIREHSGSFFFMDIDGLVKAMDVSFNEGKKEGTNEVLKWLSEMNYLSNNIENVKEEYLNRTLN